MKASPITGFRLAMSLVLNSRSAWSITSSGFHFSFVLSCFISASFSLLMVSPDSLDVIAFLSTGSRGSSTTFSEYRCRATPKCVLGRARDPNDVGLPLLPLRTVRETFASHGSPVKYFLDTSNQVVVPSVSPCDTSCKARASFDSV